MVVREYQNGYVALIAVLIVGAASLTASLALLTTGTDSQRSTLITQQATQARALAAACVEESLQTVHDNTAYTGSSNLTVGQGTCTYTVTSTGANTRVIDANGTVKGVVKKIKVYATITSSSISITSWQEVADAS